MVAGCSRDLVTAPDPPASIPVVFRVLSESPQPARMDLYYQLLDLGTDTTHRQVNLVVNPLTMGTVIEETRSDWCHGSCRAWLGVTVRTATMVRTWVVPARNIQSPADSLVSFSWPSDTSKAIEVAPPATNTFPVWPGP